MMLRFGRSRRLLSMGLTVWFVFLSVSVHLFHRHPAVPIEGGAAGVMCPVAAKWGVSTDPKGLAAPSEQDCPARRLQGLCPICLFLAKNTAQLRTASVDPPPRSAGAGYAPLDAYGFDSSLDLPAAGPRAPPC
jgi:hypothetical protein